MQDKHRFHELHRVDGAVRTASIVLDDLEDTGPAEALERRRRVLLIPSRKTCANRPAITRKGAPSEKRTSSSPARRSMPAYLPKAFDVM